MEGLELKILRIKAGLKQYEVAAKLGISANKLCEIESGRRQADDALLRRIYDVIVSIGKSRDVSHSHNKGSGRETNG